MVLLLNLNRLNPKSQKSWQKQIERNREGKSSMKRADVGRTFRQLQQYKKRTLMMTNTDTMSQGTSVIAPNSLTFPDDYFQPL